MKKIIIISFGVISLLVVILFASLYHKNESGIATNITPASTSAIQNKNNIQTTYQSPALDQSSTLSPSMQLINLPENKNIRDYIELHGGLESMSNDERNEVRTMLNIYKASIRR